MHGPHISSVPVFDGVAAKAAAKSASQVVRAAVGKALVVAMGPVVAMKVTSRNLALHLPLMMKTAVPRISSVWTVLMAIAEQGCEGRSKDILLQISDPQRWCKYVGSRT